VAVPGSKPDRKLDEYQRGITHGLDRAYAADETETQQLDLDSARIIVFSDHHKGSRDGADDFLRCEPAYCAALGHYLETGHRLVVLGDGEELWECKPAEVLRSYDQTMRLEAEFHRAGRYERFWGNHDDVWRLGDRVAKYLHPLFPGLRVREALKLRVVRGGADLGVIFLVHGHQGTLDSDRYSWFSRIVVREGWRRLQRKLKIPSTTPARDFDLRQRHDAAMFAWARTHGDRVLIAGHTHRPVFGSSQPPPKTRRGPAEIEQDLARERAHPSAPDAVAKLRGELELARAVERRADRPPLPIEPPCYFNTGCCSFGDGDVTGLEIVDGQVRLVRWLNDDYQAAPKILASADLAGVLAAVGSARRG
jgi:UDP-2,3-diacylglucosamine pyrophosphatase LpxH